MADDPPPLGPVIPVLRIFDLALARDFYQGFLGFTVDWEHTFHADAPVYLQVSRDGAVLHLSEHFGDATPGATVRILTPDVGTLHRELRERDYRYARPGLERMPWGLEVTVGDPFGNRLVFHQLVDGDGSQAEAAPIEHQLDVTCPPADAFAAFTEGIDAWWPRDYAPPGLVRVAVEPGVGGSCTMQTDDGSTQTWGTVVAWDPPQHLALDFTLAQDPAHATRLDVWFDPSEDSTRVRFSHGGWTSDSLPLRAKFTDWPVLLGRFVEYAER